jgi:hypothetical protein
VAAWYCQCEGTLRHWCGWRGPLVPLQAGIDGLDEAIPAHGHLVTLRMHSSKATLSTNDVPFVLHLAQGCSIEAGEAAMALDHCTTWLLLFPPGLCNRWRAVSGWRVRQEVSPVEVDSLTTLK